MTPKPQTPQIEVGLVGSSGMIGTPIVLGMRRSPIRASVQVADGAYRIEAARLRTAMRRSAALRRMLQNDVQPARKGTGHGVLKTHVEALRHCQTRYASEPTAELPSRGSVDPTAAQAGLAPIPDFSRLRAERCAHFVLQRLRPS